jgi:cytochrome c oxidase subunit 1
MFTLGGLSGIILANASLDIAFHDKHFLVLSCNLVCSHIVINKSSEKIKIDTEYIKMFWVGLMDGDGSIQVNQWRMKYLQYRLVIKLKYNIYNENMLIKIAKHIKGTVRITKNRNEII